MLFLQLLPEVLSKGFVFTFYTDSPPVEERNIDPDSEPSENALNNLAKEIPYSWESLGRRLGVKETKIRCIRADNVQFPSPEDKAFQMLMAWYDMGDSNYRTLEKALTAEDKGRLVKKYCRAHKET